ncbi:NUDIX hydrolase [Kitasatospora aureofaciens]|uniref:NUDIX hydrolase n=1 Tax=Kitasatospora aureofaciens TaxID=1894 RepID=UPI0036F49EFD
MPRLQAGRGPGRLHHAPHADRPRRRRPRHARRPKPAEESAVREAREEAGIEITGLRALPDPHDDLGLPLTRVLHAVWDGDESELRLGDEGLAVRMVPLGEVLDLKVPPYLEHYLPMLTEAAGLPSGSAS